MDPGQYPPQTSCEQTPELSNTMRKFSFLKKSTFVKKGMKQCLVHFNRLFSEIPPFVCLQIPMALIWESNVYTRGFWKNLMLPQGNVLV